MGLRGDGSFAWMFLAGSRGGLGRLFRWGFSLGGGIGRRDGHPHWHDDAEAAGGVAADAWTHLVAQAEGGADFHGVRQIVRVEGDDRWVAVDLYRDAEGR